MGRRTLKRMVLMLAGGVLVGSAAALNQISARDEPQMAQMACPVISYLPDYRISSLDPSVCSSVTDLIFFSLEPTPAGALDRSHLQPEALARLREWQQRCRFRLLVALGGWG